MATQAGPASWPNGQPELAPERARNRSPDHCLVSLNRAQRTLFTTLRIRGFILFGHPKRDSA